MGRFRTVLRSVMPWLGRKRGDKVSVDAPARTVSYTILDIQFIH